MLLKLYGMPVVSITQRPSQQSNSSSVDACSDHAHKTRLVEHPFIEFTVKIGVKTRLELNTMFAKPEIAKTLAAQECAVALFM